MCAYNGGTYRLVRGCGKWSSTCTGGGGCVGGGGGIVQIPGVYLE